MTNALTIYTQLTDMGSHPVLTCYGPSSGTTRLELSGKVVANHAAKIANLLSDDLLLDEGDPIEIDLPVHWRSLTWILGAALAGVVRGPSDLVVVTDNPGDHDAENQIQISLGALDLSCRNLEPGWMDGIAEPLGQADVLIDTSRALDLETDPAAERLLVDPDLETAARQLWAHILTGQHMIITTGDTEQIARSENNL